jgi:hypothetical protein
MPVAADGPRLPLTDNHRTDINQMTHNMTVRPPEKAPDRHTKMLKIVSSSATDGRTVRQQPTSRTHPTDRLVDADAVVIDFGPIRTDTRGHFSAPDGAKIKWLPFRFQHKAEREGFVNDSHLVCWPHSNPMTSNRLQTP